MGYMFLFFFSFSEMSARLLHKRKVYTWKSRGLSESNFRWIFDEWCWAMFGKFHHSLAGITPYGSTPDPCRSKTNQIPRSKISQLQRKNSCCQFANWLFTPGRYIWRFLLQGCLFFVSNVTSEFPSLLEFPSFNEFPFQKRWNCSSPTFSSNFRVALPK